MKNINLIINAGRLGFNAGAKADENETLAAVIESREVNFWEAFPVLLANASKGWKFDFHAAENCLADEDKKYLKLLIIVSLGLYDSLGLKDGWKKRLAAAFPARLTDNFRKKIGLGEELELGNITLAPERLKENFRAGFGRGASPGTAEYGGEELDAALERIFTARQKELLLKRLRRESLTKTEKEYFSRVIKKKLRALANEDLHRLARRALE